VTTPLAALVVCAALVLLTAQAVLTRRAITIINRGLAAAAPTQKGIIMSWMLTVRDLIKQKIGGFRPENKAETHRFFTELPGVFHALADS
jgi:hypothetical protein